MRTIGCNWLSRVAAAADTASLLLAAAAAAGGSEPQAQHANLTSCWAGHTCHFQVSVLLVFVYPCLCLGACLARDVVVHGLLRCRYALCMRPVLEAPALLLAQSCTLC
jgi:hypothetical protein